ncbi:MAG TPA: glycosyltransferase family 2 protein [Candidatus Blautia intestinigallinarum]|nr:glycosyltransferase family 2 protein [Candidatus Blautia intestinigallinarum]
MKKVTVVIPNFNGMKYLKECLESLRAQKGSSFETIVVDNGSSDGSCVWIRENFPEVRLLELPENLGFCRAVNEGIWASRTPYVLLLNNDIQADPFFVAKLTEAMERHPRAFSCGAKMLQYYQRDLVDDAGNYYNAMGWAFARGKDRPQGEYVREEKIFAACAGAAIYRRKIFQKIGYFDEEHFAYLEDTDIGYRARLYGYENWFVPEAVVYHVGSGTTGSRYNEFKTRYSSRNNIYMLYKNMPLWQIVLNSPFLLAGFTAKLLFFGIKGLGREYAAGIKNGFQLCKKEKKVEFTRKMCPRIWKIQVELWKNIPSGFLRK